MDESSRKLMTPDRWRQIEDLYYAAQDCPPSERATLLRRSDPEIRSLVERMLEQESGSRILDDPIAALFDRQTKPQLVAGTVLGPYKIDAQTGAGGMATVYRAIDTRLSRVVALKITSECYSEQFHLEAQAISALNHPNICTLYDVGANYLVMEFIEGSTLAARIRNGPLSPETAARYGSQIASALAEAHALGIVHCDLKPSNVMIARHGLKVLDFGLAKMLSYTGASETDAILGTPAYMAPEQVEGRDPGIASDLFALGLILYEMVTGLLPFPGASLGQMLSRRADTRVPQLKGRNPAVSARLDALVAQLLEADPARRPQNAAAVAHQLTAIADRTSARTLPFRLPLAVIPSALFLLALAALLMRKPGLRENHRVADTTPASYGQLTSFTDAATGPVLSPDGRMLAFYRSVTPFLSHDQIWVKPLPSGEPVQVTHDSRPKYNIAFSPDASQIAYTAMGSFFETYTVSTLGGDSRLMFANAAGLSWLDDRHVMFSQIKSGVHMGIVSSNLDRSGLREIYFPLEERRMAHYSYLSPDRKWVLLAEMNPTWQPCRVVPFSAGSIGRQVGPDGPCTSAAWSPDGKWVYLGVKVAGHRHLWRQRFPDGKPEQVTFAPTEEDGIAMDADGRSLVTSVFTRQNTVWIHDSHGDRALSSEGYAESNPLRFSRDGKRIYYLMRRASPEAPAELWRADLTSGQNDLMLAGVSMRDYDISDDEREVIFSTEPAGQPSQLWIAPLDRSAPPRSIGLAGDGRPFFGANHQVLFRFTEGSAHYLGAMDLDGAGRHKALPFKILNLSDISPDRRILLLGTELTGTPEREPGLVAVTLANGHIQKICATLCKEAWSADGRYFYIQIEPASREDQGGKTAAIRIPAGQTLPVFPPEAVRNLAEWLKVPGVKVLARAPLASGSNPATYAYIKPSIHANLFRIPIQ